MSSQPPLPPPPGVPATAHATPAPAPPTATPTPVEPEAEPESRSGPAVFLAIALAAAVVLGAVALVWWARAGAGCEQGSFESPRFGYRGRTPSGWTAVAAEDAACCSIASLPDGAATITATAVPLTQGHDLARFEQVVRGYVEDAGATADPSRPVTVDGDEGVAFDVRLEGDDGQVHSREVLFARDGIAWRVTLADDQVGFEANAHRLDEMLESWRFA